MRANAMGSNLYRAACDKRTDLQITYCITSTVGGCVITGVLCLPVQVRSVYELSPSEAGRFAVVDVIVQIRSTHDDVVSARCI